MIFITYNHANQRRGLTTWHRDDASEVTRVAQAPNQLQLHFESQLLVWIGKSAPNKKKYHLQEWKKEVRTSIITHEGHAR